MAEHWTAGLAALVTVNSTALVIKGPESFEGLTGAPKVWVLVLMIGGGVFVGIGIYAAHRASVGNPARRSALDELASGQHMLDGLAREWQAAVRKLIDESRRSLALAVRITLLALLLFAAALAIAWINAGNASNDDQSTCIRTANDVVEIRGSVPKVISGTLVVVPCP